jgi:hyperosmotically inducible periplasmic protein
MRLVVTTSKAVFLSALLGAALVGCGREAPEKTGAAGTSGTPPPASSTAGGAGTTGSAPDTSSTTAGGTGSAATGTTGSAGTTGTPPTAGGASTETTTPSASGGTAGTSAAPPPAGGSSSSTSGSSDTSSYSSGASGSGPASSAGVAIDDSIITTKVKTALLADAETKGTDIVVETKKGEVQLSGFVRDKAQIDKAVKVASAIEGVKKVDNKLAVKQ